MFNNIITAGSDLHDISRIDTAEPFGVVSEIRWSSPKDYMMMFTKPIYNINWDSGNL